MVTFAVFSYYAWDWGITLCQCDDHRDFKWSNVFLRLLFCDFWEILGLAGLVMWCTEFDVHHIVSIGLMVFFVWKFGTKDGTRAFSWNNVKTSAENLYIWEALMVASVLEGGLGCLNLIAHPCRH
eukprot:14679928-Ditylum_brightwellii.AAC.1